MKTASLACMFLLLSAFSRLDYNEVLICTPAEYILQRYGQPYAIHDRGGGMLDYEYVERVSMNSSLIYENHYYLRIAEGRLVKKYFREENQPPYDLMYQPDPNYPDYH